MLFRIRPTVRHILDMAPRFLYPDQQTSGAGRHNIKPSGVYFKIHAAVETPKENRHNSQCNRNETILYTTHQQPVLLSALFAAWAHLIANIYPNFITRRIRPNSSLHIGEARHGTNCLNELGLL